MAKLLTYSNALNPEILNQKVIANGYINDIIDTLEYSKKQYDVVVSRNGVITEDNFYVEDNDLIAISFKPKAGFVAIGSYILSAVGATTLAASAVASFVVGAVAYVGASMLINSLFAPKPPKVGNNSIDSSPTYSWDSKVNTANQGGVVPLLYGTHRVAPPIIGKYIESVGAQQYLNLLFAVADGETSIDTSTIKINDEGIENFKNISVITRPGTVNQTPIGIFDSIRSDKSINRKLQHQTSGNHSLNLYGTEYSTTETSGNNVNGISVSITAPQGLWCLDDGDDGLLSVSVEFSIEYRIYGSSDNWLPIGGTPTDATRVVAYWVRGGTTYYKYTTKTQATNAYNTGVYTGYLSTQTTLPVNTIGAGTCLQEEEVWVQDIYGTAFTEDKCVAWTPIFAEIEHYTYINPIITKSAKSQSALRWTYGVSNLPANQYEIRVRHHKSSVSDDGKITSSLYFDYMQEEVDAPLSYPTTALMAMRVLATDQLSGSMPRVSVVASNDLGNPSLACKDIIEKTGHTLSTKELESFSAWETHCNTKNYSCNIYIDQSQTVRQILDIIAPLGRGNVLQTGSNWRVIIDRANEEAVQGFLFTMGNIVKDSFSEEFLPIQDRANKIELTYYDKNYDYAPQILELSNANYDNVDEVNSISLNYIGCTDRDMAMKYAKYLLNTNRYITITQNFQVDLEAIIARVGDIIKVAHDVPEQGMASGRIISSTTTTAVLDNEVDMTASSRYYIEVRRFDTNTIEVVEVINSGTITDTLTFKTPLVTALNQYDIYSFGELSRISKKMRILSISNTSELKSTISAIEYVPEVYNDAVTIQAEDLSYFGVKYLRADEFITYYNTSAISNVNISWIGESLWYDIYMNGIFNHRVYGSQAIIKDIQAPSTIEIEIRDSYGHSATITKTLLGRFAPPAPPSEFKAIQNGEIVRFKWVKSIDLDVVQYEIRQGATWESGFKIGKVGNVTTFEWYPDMDGTYRFWIKALDASGVYSTTAEEYQLNIQNINDNINVVIEYDGLEIDTPPCGTTTGLIFVVGTGYVPVISAQYSDLTSVTYIDLASGLTYDELPTFESCALDTVNIGLTKIRLFAEYSAVSTNVTYLTYPNRTYNAFPYDTYETISSLTDLRFYYSISDDNITYSTFTEYTGIVDEIFRYIKFKYEFVGEIEGKNISISDFKALLDVPDIEYEIIGKQVVNSETISYNSYNLTFYSAPYVSVTSIDSVSLPVVKNITATSFDLEAYDKDGVATTANFNISIKGY